MSPTGRQIQEEVIKLTGIDSPLKIGILETPTGFEVNAIHSWPERMQEFYEKSLQNLKPVIARVRAWRKNGEHSTADPQIVDSLLDQDVIYAGAGSPSYTVLHLKNSRAYSNLLKVHQKGAILMLGSATAAAVGKYALPVYEIFKAGHDLRWLDGLDLFSSFGLNLVIIPHWNNQEGEDFDTSRCWMGTDRFAKLLKLLPADAVILGIDEQTAAVFDFTTNSVEVMGVGKVTVIKSNKTSVYAAKKVIEIEELKF